MSKDIYLDDNGALQTRDTDVYKGYNILKTQLGKLVYALNLGIDLASFINSEVQIQEQTFIAYTTQQLANQGVRITEIAKITSELKSTLQYTVAKPTIEGE